MLAVFTANRQSHSADFNDPVEFDRMFRDITGGRIASVLLMFEHDKAQVERFLLTHELDLPALIGASSELERPLTDFQGNRHFGQMVVVNTASGRAVVRVLVANRGLGRCSRCVEESSDREDPQEMTEPGGRGDFLQEKARIGSDSEPGFVLGHPSAITVDRRGHVYVADMASMTVKVFNGAGRPLRRFGARGRDPGQFLAIGPMSLVGPDELAIVDNTRGALSSWVDRWRLSR